MEFNKWEKWEKTRARGTFHYVVIHGILGFGIPLGLFMWLCDYFIFQRNENHFELSYLVLHFGICLAGGFIYRLIDWFFSETAYQRSRKNKDFNIWIPKQKDNL